MLPVYLYYNFPIDSVGPKRSENGTIDEPGKRESHRQGLIWGSSVLLFFRMLTAFKLVYQTAVFASLILGDGRYQVSSKVSCPVIGVRK